MWKQKEWKCTDKKVTAKTNKPYIFTIFSNCALFSKNWWNQEPQTKKLKYVSVLYNSNELSADWISKGFQNPTILLSRKIKSLI